MSKVRMAGAGASFSGSASSTDSVAPSGVRTSRSWTSPAAQPQDTSSATTNDKVPGLVLLMVLRPVKCAAMSILDRILGRTPTTTPQITAQPPKAQSAAAPPPVTELPEV